MVPDKRFDHLNVDIVKLPESNGYSYLLTVVDRFSPWPVAVPMRHITAESVADAFAHGWVAAHGVPSTITTDRGAQFGSEIWNQLLKAWGIRSNTTTAYHPEANGLVEQFHRRLKEALLATAPDEPSKWFWRLPCVLLSIRTTLKPDLGATPSDLVYGEGLAVPGSLLSTASAPEAEQQQQRHTFLNNLRMEVERLQPKPTSNHQRWQIQIPEDLESASHVFIRRGGDQPSLTTPYVGPYQVVSKHETHFRGVDSVALA